MSSRRPLALIVAAVLLAVLLILPVGHGSYFIYLLCSWLMFTIAAMGLNLTLGYAGRISLAQASFMGVGAYTTAILTLHGWPWLAAAPVGVLLCFVVGLLLGFPALRVRGHFLAFVTLAFNTLFFLVARNEDWLTGGSYGLSDIPRPRIGPISADGQLAFYYFTLAVSALAILALWGIVRSPWGRAFKALRENEVRAESLGLDTRRITLLAFAIGSAFGGLAGAIEAPLVQYIEPNSFAVGESLKVLLMVVVGGLGDFWGPALGAAMVVLLPEALRGTRYYLIVYALFVIALMVLKPTGLMGIGKTFLARLAKSRAAAATEAKP
ncbi:MAG: branched-chain amino acid ABC transporter permease [Hyphomicrobiales bacterium]|nr:branched-chain amino acid ABC transporter permease [Hyphomicrobiales bacterium]MDE2016629.1 branched-chain amino acid ABC transporter permease [Hyphomicrobiales bacterium]